MIQEPHMWPLPPELTLHIFSYLGLKDLSNMRCCRNFDQFFEDEQFWKDFSKRVINLYLESNKFESEYAAVFTKLIYFKDKKNQSKLRQVKLKEKKFASLRTAAKTKELMIILAGGLPKFLKIPISNDKSLNISRGVDSKSRSFIAFRWINRNHRYRGILRYSPKEETNLIYYIEKKNGTEIFGIPLVKNGLLTFPDYITMIQEKIALNLSSHPS